MVILSFIVVVLTGITVIIYLIILSRRDPLKSAFIGLTASLILLAGSLGSQSIKLEASIPKNDVFGIPMEVKTFTVSGNPPYLWIIAFLTIAVLLARFGKLINDNKKITESLTSS